MRDNFGSYPSTSLHTMSLMPGRRQMFALSGPFRSLTDGTDTALMTDSTSAIYVAPTQIFLEPTMAQPDLPKPPGTNVRITRADEGLPFTPTDDHHGVYPVRLHGGAAGATDRLNAGRSHFTSGARVDRGPVTGETLYVVIDGELSLDVDRLGCALLRTGDSVYMPKGTMRALCAGPDGATILVVRNP